MREVVQMENARHDNFHPQVDADNSLSECGFQYGPSAPKVMALAAIYLAEGSPLAWRMEWFS